MERDLRTLRRSRLMNYSEFRTMATSLERYNKDLKVAIMIGRKEKKEMDMKPYLYDEGDSYEKPFYMTLLKMLYEVSTSTFYDKQYEDLTKIYKWYCANKELITSPPNVTVPITKARATEEDKEQQSISDNENDAGETAEIHSEKFNKVPKLHFRPKTAPPIEKHKGTRYVTWNEAQKTNGPKRANSGQRGFRYQQNKEQLVKSLRISPFGPHSEVPYIADKNYNPYLNRPCTAPPFNRTTQVRLKDSDELKSFILKPYSTPVPMSSPISSPLTSPRDSPRDSPLPFRSKSPQLSLNFAPDRAKETLVKLNVRLPQEVDRSRENGHRSAATNGTPTLPERTDTENEKENREGLKDLPTKLPNQEPLPKNASATEIERIIQHQRREEELLEEQHNLLQKRLLHEYDRYAKDCARAEKERLANVEMVDGQLALNANGGQRTMAPVGTYDLSSPRIIPSYNRVYSQQQDGHTRSKSAGGGTIQSGYSPARHLRHATVPLNRSEDVINVDAVLGMVTPIGLQMEYDRERSVGFMPSGLKQAVTSIAPHVVPSQTPRQVTASTSPSSVSTASEDTDSRRSSLSEQKPLELKSKEPVLSPERNSKDYTVHFHQSKSPPEQSSKHYKVSGLVSPDTIRYQWTDDGFGSMTYMKRLKSPVSPRPSKKKTNTSQNAKPSPDQVTMPTGSRSLDRRTLASLMVVRQLGDSERRRNDRFGGPTSGNPTAATEADYNYNLEYMSICQPVGPRLGESERPSTMAWYLQGDHGLYRDPSSPRIDSDEIRRKKDIRMAQDRSLMIEGKHIGAGDSGDSGEHSTPPVEEKGSTSMTSTTPAEQEKTSNDTSSYSSTSKEDEKPAATPPTKQRTPIASLRPTSPSPRRPVSASSQPRHIAIPTGRGSCSPTRPCSARSEKTEKTYNFSVKQFNHFCWPDEAILTDDYVRQRQVWAAVNIQRIFRGFMARQYYETLQEAERDRQRRAALTLQSHLRGFLTRKKLDVKMEDYTPSTRTKEWAREYKDDLKKREAARLQKKQYILLKLNKDSDKQDEQIKNARAHQNIFDIYHPTPEGPTKAQMKAAAITLQRYFRGWFVRRMYQKVKTKALKRTLSFNKFIKGYQSLLFRIQKRYGVKDPTSALQFNELMEYVERLNKYEIAFEKFAVDGVLKYNNIKKYFEACGHVPSQKEIDKAIEIVTKMSPKGRNLTKAEAVEVLFQIYVPKGTGLTLKDVRTSTWLNPLNDGQDIMQLLSKKDLEATNLSKCLALVANAGKENEEIQDLLRPASAKNNTKMDKKNDKPGKSRRTTLAQYPLRPSSPSSSRSKSPKPSKTRR